MNKNREIQVLDKEIQYKRNWLFWLTDIARYKNPLEPKEAVRNWLRRKDTIEYLGLWEQLNNPNFKGVEFDAFRYSIFTFSTKCRVKIRIWKYLRFEGNNK